MNKKQISLFIVLIIAIIAQSIYIVTLTQRVDNLSNAVSNISFNNDSDKLSKRIDEIESKIASFSDDLHSLSNNIDDNTAEIVSIKRQLSDVVYKINSLISDINLYILSRWLILLGRGMVMSINLIYTQLKKTQTAVVRLNEDGSHSILVNLNKPLDAQRVSVLHELGHIKHDDFHSKEHINLIERIAHDRELDEDIDEEFFYHVVNSKDV